MDDDLRISRFSRGTKIAVAATLAGLFVVFFVLPRYVRYRQHEEAVEREAAEAPYRAEQAKLEEQLVARLGPLAKLEGEAPATCPAAVTGTVPVLQREWLAYAVSHDAYPSAPLLSSPGLMYWANAWTPSDTKGLAEKSKAERELLAAPHVVVIAADSSAVHSTSEHVFEGGEIKGAVLVVDVAAKTIVCASTLATQPEFVVAVKQDSAEGDRWAMQSAERDAIADAFWTGLAAQLAKMAPGAQLVKAR